MADETVDNLVITNASLTAFPSTNLTNHSDGVLTLTLVHTGAFEGTPLSVSMRQLGGSDFTTILQTAPIGQTGTYKIPIPASFPLTRGLRYQVVVDSTYVFTTGTLGTITNELDIALTAN
jgi:hypothetical protein